MKILLDDPQTWLSPKPKQAKHSSLLTFCLSTTLAAIMLSLLITASTT